MKTIKSYTDLEQSHKLAEILPIESADMNYWCGTQIRIGGHRTMDKDLDVPCWSLSSLLGVLPEKYTELIKEGGMYRIIIKDSYMTSLFYNPVDACVAMIEKLHELKML